MACLLWKQKHFPAYVAELGSCFDARSMEFPDYEFQRVRMRATEMHHSRLCAVLIDCKTSDIDQAARFWSEAWVAS